MWSRVTWSRNYTKASCLICETDVPLFHLSNEWRAESKVSRSVTTSKRCDFLRTDLPTNSLHYCMLQLQHSGLSQISKNKIHQPIVLLFFHFVLIPQGHVCSKQRHKPNNNCLCIKLSADLEEGLSSVYSRSTDLDLIACKSLFHIVHQNESVRKSNVTSNVAKCS